MAVIALMHDSNIHSLQTCLHFKLTYCQYFNCAYVIFYYKLSFLWRLEDTLFIDMKHDCFSSTSIYSLWSFVNNENSDNSIHLCKMSWNKSKLITPRFLQSYWIGIKRGLTQMIKVISNVIILPLLNVSKLYLFLFNCCFSVCVVLLLHV